MSYTVPNVRRIPLGVVIDYLRLRVEPLDQVGILPRKPAAPGTDVEDPPTPGEAGVVQMTPEYILQVLEAATGAQDVVPVFRHTSVYAAASKSS